jgi:hypothetical protein
MAVLHPPALALAEVRAADELHTGDLRATLRHQLYVDEPPFIQAANRC